MSVAGSSSEERSSSPAQGGRRQGAAGQPGSQGTTAGKQSCGRDCCCGGCVAAQPTPLPSRQATMQLAAAHLQTAVVAIGIHSAVRKPEAGMLQVEAMRNLVGHRLQWWGQAAESEHAVQCTASGKAGSEGREPHCPPHAPPGNWACYRGASPRPVRHQCNSLCPNPRCPARPPLPHRWLSPEVVADPGPAGDGAVAAQVAPPHKVAGCRQGWQQVHVVPGGGRQTAGETGMSAVGHVCQQRSSWRCVLATAG